MGSLEGWVRPTDNTVLDMLGIGDEGGSCSEIGGKTFTVDGPDRDKLHEGIGVNEGPDGDNQRGNIGIQEQATISQEGSLMA